MATKRYVSKGKVRYLRKPSRKKSFLKFLIPVLLVLALLYVLGTLGEGRSSEYTDYVIQVNKLVRESNETAKGFNELKEQVSMVSRAELKARLAQYIKDCADAQNDSALTKVPERLKKTHPYLQLCFEMRTKGMEDYQLAIFNALKDEDLEVAGVQVSKALRYLALSDDAYGLYREKTEELLKEEGIDASLLESRFLDDERAFEGARVLSYLQQLKGIETLEVIHGVAVVELETNPKRTEYNKETRTATLPEADDFVVTVTIENQGNQIENNIPVEVTLKSETDPEGQIKSARVSSLAAGKKEIVTIQGLEPTGGGVVNLLTVTVGPLPGEKITTNNTREYKFVIK